MLMSGVVAVKSSIIMCGRISRFQHLYHKVLLFILSLLNKFIEKKKSFFNSYKNEYKLIGMVTSKMLAIPWT
uniref:Uncharacterized protein n=1 Tax=Utricularia reniformis TaxID=192314 RepID=A0A1Y0B483_9LAMI|nr:hypothetical protein AEK19_MT2066 [Utricularia reniformis]ART32222.1 hypothetical protein AEK19_MT2066 [Utricularia reniformis]